MEGKLEGFDPAKHKMLEDKKSWVNKETYNFLLSEYLPKKVESQEVKNQYNEFVDRIVAANPDLSSQQAYDKIQELEEKYSPKFFGTIYNENLVFERERLSQLEELNLATEEKQTLEQLKLDFARITAEIAEATGDNPEKIKKNLDTILTNYKNIARDLFEAKEIMVGNPIVEGFEETQDVHIPNDSIREFLKNTFTPQALREAEIGRIEKDDKYLIMTTSRMDAQRNELKTRGLVVEFSGNMLLAENREKYLQAEMFLEEVDDPSQLKHTFKIRSSSGESYDFANILVRSFDFSKPEDFDYLTTAGLESEEDQMRAYILGTIAHEITHRYETYQIRLQIQSRIFEEYKQILEEEIAPQLRPKFVSDYVFKHFEIYKSNEEILSNEDLSETVRLYTTNPGYLKNNYPRRFSFIEKNFPFIKAGGVIEAVKGIKK
jgi:hypothetical protein